MRRGIAERNDKATAPRFLALKVRQLNHTRRIPLRGFIGRGGKFLTCICIPNHDALAFPNCFRNKSSWILWSKVPPESSEFKTWVWSHRCSKIMTASHEPCFFLQRILGIGRIVDRKREAFCKGFEMRFRRDPCSINLPESINRYVARAGSAYASFL